MDGSPWFVSGDSVILFGSRGESCSAREPLQKVNPRSSLKTKVRPWGIAANYALTLYSNWGKHSFSTYPNWRAQQSFLTCHGPSHRSNESPMGFTKLSVRS